MAVDDISSQDDDWSTGVMYFREALQALSLDAEGQIEAIGGPNAAWELRQDAVDFGRALLDSSNGRLSGAVEDGIHALVEALEQLPEEAYQGASIKALVHPRWDSVRSMAETLLVNM